MMTLPNQTTMWIRAPSSRSLLLLTLLSRLSISFVRVLLKIGAICFHIVWDPIICG